MTRLLSVGRQFRKLAKEPVKINPMCSAARTLGTDTVELYSVGIVGEDFVFHGRAFEPAESGYMKTFALIEEKDLV